MSIRSKSSAASPFYNSKNLIAATSLSYFDYKTLFLATKLAYFKLNEPSINRLINSLLTMNAILNHEIDMLFSNNTSTNQNTSNINKSDDLLETCIENSIDYDFIMAILWNRIHYEPLVMKFISLRYSNYATNVVNGNYSNSYQSIMSSNNTTLEQTHFNDIEWSQIETAFFPIF